MKKPVQYTESQPISPNVFLVFFLIVTILLVIANILPVSSTSYFIFFLLGIAAPCILFLEASYKITVRENVLEISVKFLISIVLKKIDLTAVQSMNGVEINDKSKASFAIEKNTGCISYLTKSSTAVKVTLFNNKSYIISTVSPLQLMTVVTSFNK